MFSTIVKIPIWYKIHIQIPFQQYANKTHNFKNMYFTGNKDN
jgi:hypothetical protein